MERDTLLKGTEEKKKEVTSKGKKPAASAKSKKPKTEKTARKTVKKVEEPKGIKTSQEVPETKPETEEKQPESTPAQVTDVVEKIASPATEEPGKNSIRIYVAGAGAALLLLAVLLTASFTNSNTFSFKQKDNTVEMWKGYFAPMGMESVRTFSDMQLPADEEGKTIINDTYTRGEAYDILFQHFLSRADETLSREEAPDFKEINALLKEARKYALTDNAKETVSLRKNGLRFMVLMGKASLALAGNKEEDLIAAKEHLAELDRIAATPIQQHMIKQKAAAVESALKELRGESSATQTFPF